MKIVDRKPFQGSFGVGLSEAIAPLNGYTVTLAPKGDILNEGTTVVWLTGRFDYRGALREAHRLYPEHDVVYCFGPYEARSKE